MGMVGVTNKIALEASDRAGMLTRVARRLNPYAGEPQEMAGFLLGALELEEPVRSSPSAKSQASDSVGWL